jgi:hypothetical protein
MNSPGYGEARPPYDDVPLLPDEKKGSCEPWKTGPYMTTGHIWTVSCRFLITRNVLKELYSFFKPAWLAVLEDRGRSWHKACY